MLGETATLKLDVVVLKLASTQLGLVSRQQLVGLGVSDQSIRRRVAAKLLVRVHSGVFRIGSSPTTFEQRCLAACLAVENAAIIGRSAAIIHKLPVGSQPMNPEIVVKHGTSFDGKEISTRRTRHPFATQPWLTGRIATVSATLLACAGSVDRETLGRCIDHAIANRLVTVDRMLSEVNARPIQRFAGRKALLVELHSRSEGRVQHRSALERKVKRWLVRGGLTGSRPNLIVKTAIGDVEVDFGWLDEKVALEISPFFTHGSKRKQARDTKRRNALIAMGWRFVEASDDDLVDYISFVPTITTIKGLLAIQ